MSDDRIVHSNSHSPLFSHSGLPVVSASPRRKEILKLLRDQDFVQTAELSVRFGVSEVSIRKDLNYLERRGLVRRVHGGAQLATDALALLNLTDRYTLNRAEKETISREALRLLDRPNLCIFVDTGSTSLFLAQAIPADLAITVVTNSLSTVAALEGKPACRVFMLGGLVNYRRKILQGPWSDEQIERSRFDLVFTGADGVSADGFDCDDLVEGQDLRKTVARARASYVLADSSKAGKPSRSLYARPGDVTAWITDDGVPAALVEQIQANGGKVIIAREDPDTTNPKSQASE